MGKLGLSQKTIHLMKTQTDTGCVKNGPWGVWVSQDSGGELQCLRNDGGGLSATYRTVEQNYRVSEVMGAGCYQSDATLSLGRLQRHLPLAISTCFNWVPLLATCWIDQSTMVAPPKLLMHLKTQKDLSFIIIPAKHIRLLLFGDIF